MSKKPPSLTLGIEEEYQIIDPETRELTSYITHFLDEGVMVERELKAELMQSQVELGTSVCTVVADLYEELARQRGDDLLSGRPPGPEDRIGGNPPLLALADAGSDPTRALLSA